MVRNLTRSPALHRARTSGRYVMDAVLSTDSDNTLHVRAFRFGKLLSATSEKYFESGRRRCNEHFARRIADILESVNALAWHERHAATFHLLPLAVLQECHFTFLNEEELVFVEVVMWRRTAIGWRNLRPQRNFSSGLRPTKMDDNLFTKRMHDVADARRNDYGTQFGNHSHEDSRLRRSPTSGHNLGPRGANALNLIGTWSP